MKDKRIEIRISGDFNKFLEGIWQISKFRDIGIRSKSDLIRYSLLKTIEDQNKGTLIQFRSIPEIRNYLPEFRPFNNQEISNLKDKIELYQENKNSNKSK
ncbi:MAG: hypothetical protein CMC79_01840 [Flavobacteriaceae bacterium]|nr:hypothetical protein [Flavobacteriaceae bacterium]|tara:strand:- start:8 stop:307 length:300 start_codon:yes stop_codon:yes gene_type:complete